MPLWIQVPIRHAHAIRGKLPQAGTQDFEIDLLRVSGLSLRPTALRQHHCFRPILQPDQPDLHGLTCVAILGVARLRENQIVSLSSLDQAWMSEELSKGMYKKVCLVSLIPSILPIQQQQLFSAVRSFEFPHLPSVASIGSGILCISRSNFPQKNINQSNFTSTTLQISKNEERHRSLCPSRPCGRCPHAPRQLRQGHRGLGRRLQQQRGQPCCSHLHRRGGWFILR